LDAALFGIDTVDQGNEKSSVEGTLMQLWKVEVFDNTTDTDPVKTGFFYAKSEDDASAMVTSTMGEAWRADFYTTVTGPDKIPEGFVAWLS
jgi:hypothetical protein